ncbi:MAG: hypothetical protein GYB68_19140 [Chloroflexi bacterium]|nr:hypothetical protein [Chloroflexota bacterium]
MRRAFIATTWTEDSADDDIDTLIKAIDRCYDSLQPLLGRFGQFNPLPQLKVFGSWELSNTAATSPFPNFEWMIDRSLSDDGKAVVASRFVDMVHLEPWQSSFPHFDLTLIDLPLIDDVRRSATHYDALGMCQPGLVSVISTAPLEVIDDPDLRALTLSHIVAHYLGRLVGTLELQPAGYIYPRAPHRHCLRTCAMRYLDDNPMLALSFAQEQAEKGLIYCSDCQHDMVAAMVNYRLGIN